MKLKARNLVLLALPLFLAACLGKPAGINPVNDFQLERYLGDWYEIARLDHSFERGLSHVTANYSLREDGGVRVINRGWSADDESWQQAEGKAFFVEDTDTGFLKVSFFGPFYGSYIIFELDHDGYQYSFVSGPDTNYLWLLARQPVVDDVVWQDFTRQAERLGFDTSKLIRVDHQSSVPTPDSMP